MDIGRLDKRITIQSPNPTADANGEMVPNWVTVAVVWASVVDMTGREYIAAAATQNAAQTKIEIRYRPDIVPSMRVLLAGAAYNIEAVLGQDHVSLLLMCTRVES